MKLAAAARYFDAVPATDGYTGAPLFKCQVTTYDGNKRDSETAVRRVMSVAADVAIPTRRVINIQGTRYIVGHAYPDFTGPTTTRVGYVITEATDFVSVRTLGQACRGDVGTQAWACRVWVKNEGEASQDSKLTPQFKILLSSTEVSPKGMLVSFGSDHLLARSVQLGEAGNWVSTSDLLDSPFETAQVKTGNYDPVFETIDAVPVATTVMRLRWQSQFAYGNKNAPTFGPDDIQLAIARTALTVEVGAVVTLSDGEWQVMDVAAQGDVWLCRATHHD